MRKRLEFQLKFIVCICLSLHYQAAAQDCIDDFFAITYKGSQAFSLSRSIITTKNEIICAGNIRYERAGLISSDGWIAKMSLKGTVLWSKRFKMPGFNYAVLHDIVQGSDDSYFAVGEAQDTVGGFDVNNIKGVMLHVDKYGNLIQSGSVQISGLQEDQTIFKCIQKTSDGDFVIGGYNNYGKFSSGITNLKGVLLLIDKAGNLKWITTYSSPKYEFRYLYRHVIIETKDGQLVTALVAQEFNAGNTQLPLSAFYFISVDKNTGRKNWDNLYSGLKNPALVSLSYVSHISEMPGGNLSFTSSFSDSANNTQSNYNGKSVNLITNSRGNIQRAVSYYNKRPGSAIAAGLKLNDNGDQLFFMDDGASNILIKTDKDGKLVWQNAFGNFGHNPIPASLNHTLQNTNYLFMNERYDGNIIHLYKTDTTASIDCVQTGVDVNTEDATPYFKQSDSEMTIVPSGATDFLMHSLPVISDTFPIVGYIDCRKLCCVDAASFADTIVLCDAPSYSLPNNDIVTVSNTYYHTYKSVSGCDSLVFYPVIFSKKPVINLGPDNCLDGMDSIQLTTGNGYTVYKWMDTITTDSTYTVKQPGTYWVEVANSCGTKIDSVQIFEKCDFEIYIPNAFTPNDDGINDYFGIPDLNQNRVIKLKIYNRWGKLIFETSDTYKRWDGRYKKLPQPTGIYIYNVEMKNFREKKTTKSGVITLLR